MTCEEPAFPPKEPNGVIPTVRMLTGFGICGGVWHEDQAAPDGIVTVAREV